MASGVQPFQVGALLVCFFGELFELSGGLAVNPLFTARGAALQVRLRSFVSGLQRLLGTRDSAVFLRGRQRQDKETKNPRLFA